MAQKNDIDAVVDLRLNYFCEVYEHFSDDEKALLKNNNISFLHKELGKTCFVSIAIENGKVLSSAYMSVYLRAPNRGCSSGAFGEIYGVYTHNDHRGMGLATKCIKHLMDVAVKKGIKSIKLGASDDGYPLYKKLGFTDEKSGYKQMIYEG